MSYVPETLWIGGVCPSAQPAHLHHVDTISLAIPAVPYGGKLNAIVSYVLANGPIPATIIATALGRSLDSIRGQLRVACIQGRLIKEARWHLNRRNRIMFYSGAKAS